MSANPVISIVLPTFNGVRYVRQSIESCLCQTYTKWELIIVDDASTDETPRVIAEYAARDNRLRIIRNNRNRQLPASLNIGFAHARGEFYTWTSDDNCYRPEALGKMLGFLESHDNADIVYAQFSVIDDAGTVVAAGWASSLEKLAYRNAIGACFLYRKYVHERLGGYAEELVLVEDYDFWLRASIQFHVCQLDEDLYLYREHAHSLTATKLQRIRLAREECLARNLPHMTWLNPTLRYDAMRALEAGKCARRAIDGILAAIPERQSLILVDEEQIRTTVALERRAIPFLERDGQYWGPPSDDVTAIREFERLRRTGVNFMVFAQPAFWWLDHYSELHCHLRSSFHCVLENDVLVVFDLGRKKSSNI